MVSVSESYSTNNAGLLINICDQISPSFTDSNAGCFWKLHLSMGLLDQLWDDTVAGPPPDSGLGKLRKYPTFSSRQTSGKAELLEGAKSYGEESANEATKVTRKIMIIKPPTVGTESPPISPAGSTPPVSPFSGSGGVRGEPISRFRRRSISDVYERRASTGPRSSSSPHNV